MTELCGRDDNNPLAASRRILSKYDIAVPFTLKEVRDLTHWLEKGRQNHLLTSLRDKVVHGLHRLTIEDSSIDRAATFGWLHDGRFREATEALIIAAQDGTLITRHYEKSVLGKNVNATPGM